MFRRWLRRRLKIVVLDTSPRIGDADHVKVSSRAAALPRAIASPDDRIMRRRRNRRHRVIA
jgi:hypothetical protein